jgi:hypothetical protein
MSIETHFGMSWGNMGCLQSWLSFCEICIRVTTPQLRHLGGISAFRDHGWGLTSCNIVPLLFNIFLDFVIQQTFAQF